ncbi:MAG: hypothetical protein M3305_16775 [Actinomycetota bacterium]|nr:hypothetical protein [Actinomycetota bacterium]
MSEEAGERQDNEWEGTPLQMGSGMDPYGIKEVILEFDTGDKEVLLPRIREEFQSYELHQTAAYLETLSNQLGVHRK